MYNGGSDGVYFYNNSISLDFNASTTGLTNGIYQVTAATNIDFKNNAIKITRAGVGAKQGFYFATNTTTFTSNYNNIYVPNGVIGYWNGVNIATLADWQALNTTSPYDMNSITSNPLFNSNRILIPQTGTPLAGAGTGILSITTDRLGNTRATSPYIGAYEAAGDYAGPSITAAPISNTTSTANYVLNNYVTITDVSGVDTTLGNRPRLYFKRKNNANTFVNNTSSSNGWKYVEASNTTTPFSFVINYSLLDSAVVVGDELNYFYVAKDLLGNITTSPSDLNNESSSINLTSNNFPAFSPGRYNIGSGISGTLEVGTGKAFTTLTGNGGLFNYINTNIVNGNVTVLITSNLTETGVHPLNQIAELGVGGYTFTIKPNGDTLRTITGSYVGGLIRLNGADRIIIDGSGSNNGRYLSITNNTATSNNAAIQLISLGKNLGATNNTIKNCIVTAGTAGNAIGIHLGGPTLPYSAGATNNNNKIIGNHIFRGSVGIFSGGIDTAQTDSLIITDNIIGSDITSENLRLYGMALEVSQNSRVERNIVKNIINTAAQQAWGIALYDGFKNGIISKNQILKVSSGSGAFAGRGIEIISGKDNENITIDNNFIAEMNGVGSANLAVSAATGISIRATGGVKLYYNSVNMTGTFSSTTGANPDISAALHLGVGAKNIDMVNNSFANTRLNSNDTSYAYALYSEVGDTSWLAFNYNNYYATPVANQGIIAYVPSIGNVNNLATLRLATNKNVNSISLNPNHTSSLNFRPLGINLYQKGTPLVNFTSDIESQTRSTTTPCIGADEYTLPPVEIKLVAVIYPNNNNCGSNSDSVRLVIENLGLATQTGFVLKANLSEAATANLTKTYNKNLIAGGIDTVNIGYYNGNVSDTLQITAIVDALNDANRNNDTIKTSRVLLSTPVPPTIVSSNATCIGESATLVASAGTNNLRWFDAAQGGNLLVVNDTLTTPALARKDTFYVEATNNSTQTYNVGPLNPAAVGPGGGTAAAITTYYMEFQVFQNVELKSVDIFPTAAIGSSSAITIQTPTGVTIGTVAYVTTVTGGTTKQTVDLNIQLSPGIYRMGQTPAITLFRNTSGASYPYTSPALNILSNNFGAGYYYYFYNWQVRTGVLGCASPRIPVVANVLPSPSGATVAQAAPFQGVFNAGTLSNPDEACLADTLTYVLTPPTGFTVGGLGTTWNVTNTQVKTLGGANPAGSIIYNGLNMTYVAASGDLDSTLVFKAKVVNLATGCDSDVVRYLKLNKAPIVALGNDITICEGTTTTLNAGNAGATYLWSNGATTQSITVGTAGTYSVTVTNSSGCSSTDALVVTTIPSPSKALGPDINACVGQNVVLDAGNPNATYSWNTGATSRTINPVTSGLYIVIVTGTGGCTTTDSINVVFNALPVVNLGSDINICIEDTTVLDAGNPGSTYLWSTGATTRTIKVNTAGTYSVTVTNTNGCANSDQVVVTNKPAPIASYTDTALNGLNVKFTATTVAGNSYLWNFGDPTSPTNTSALPNPIHEFTQPGTYTVTLTVTNVASGCVSVLKRTINVVFVGISSANKEVFNFYAAPNPFVGSTSLNFNLKKTSMVKIEMFDLLGRKVKSIQDLTELTAGDHKIELNNTNAELPNGIYLIKLNVDGNESVIRVQDNTSK